MMWQNTLTGTIYNEILNVGHPYSRVRSARTGKTTRVLSDHLWDYEPSSQLAFDDEVSIENPTAGEPIEDAADVPDRREILRQMAREGQEAGMHDLGPMPSRPSLDDLPEPRLPALQETLRGTSYNTGSVIVLLAEMEEHWPLTSKVAALRVAGLLIEDEIARICDRA